MIFGGPGFGGGFVVGFGTGFISRELAMLTMAIAKPLAQTMVRASMLGIERSKESLAHLKETFEDMMAEVREGMEMRESDEEEVLEVEDKKKDPRVESSKREQSDELRSGRGENDSSKIRHQHKGSTP